ncbi:uncharacterized protein E6C27_scaffold89G002390 [Cucumis melo var. makuwa]|uniref:Uncharacterized protein n=1 Tax=Cucumis melo var. makuwa TaxID=1194695 RepID=A0A5A7V2Y5_CUCMM|nr:uncharacterized protein E6C27_scaffold89G002390 [Cucumis melo var. makuwa]
MPVSEEGAAIVDWSVAVISGSIQGWMSKVEHSREVILSKVVIKEIGVLPTQPKTSTETTSGITGSPDAQDKTSGEKSIFDTLGLALKKASYPDAHYKRQENIVGNTTTLIIAVMVALFVLNLFLFGMVSRGGSRIACKVALLEGEEETEERRLKDEMLMNVGVLNCWSNKLFNMLLELLRAVFPMCSTTIPSSFYEAKRKLRDLGLGYEIIHACKYHCVLYWKESANLQHCPTCGEVRDKRVETDDVLRYPVDAEGWKHFDSEYPDFASDPRNVYLSFWSTELV